MDCSVGYVMFSLFSNLNDRKCCCQNDPNGWRNSKTSHMSRFCVPKQNGWQSLNSQWKMKHLKIVLALKCTSTFLAYMCILFFQSSVIECIWCLVAMVIHMYATIPVKGHIGCFGSYWQTTCSAIEVWDPWWNGIFVLCTESTLLRAFTVSPPCSPGEVNVISQWCLMCCPESKNTLSCPLRL